MKAAGQEPTRAQIERFIKIRRKSGFASNLQFMIDAKQAGFSVSDLPKVEKLEDGSYCWKLSHGVMTENLEGIKYTPTE